RKSGHSQLFYAVPSVCTTENARAKPIQYMKAIYAAFAARLDADVDYHGGPVAKTPGHPWWETTEFHSHVYELGELASAVELTVKPWATGP
ncbi:replication initiation protein, partial [Pseudomonas savastanoi]